MTNETVNTIKTFRAIQATGDSFQLLEGHWFRKIEIRKVSKTKGGSEAIWKLVWKSRSTAPCWLSLTCLPSSVYSNNDSGSLLEQERLRIIMVAFVLFLLRSDYKPVCLDLFGTEQYSDSTTCKKSKKNVMEKSAVKMTQGCRGLMLASLTFRSSTNDNVAT